MKTLLINILFCLAFYSVQAQKHIVVLKSSDPQTIDAESIGFVKFKDKAFKVSCTYDKSIDLLIEKAKAVNANLVKITRHKKPDGFNSCHRFDAKLYKVDNSRDYEKEILWSSKRKLEWADFLEEKKPLAYNAIALTRTGISFHVSAQTSLYANGTNCTVDAIFYTKRSWVTTDSTERTEDVLEHEQKHFDLCEIYARRLYKELTEAKINAYTIDKANEIYERIMSEYEERQYQYDDETHNATDNEAQQRWNDAISSELDELAEYADRN